MKKKSVNKILQETRDIYNQIASEFSDTRGKFWRGFGGFARYAKAEDKVLDLGCGNGRMAEIFEGMGVQYLGVDNSEELIKIARERFKDKDWVRFEVGDAQSVKLPDSEYDLVLSIAVLHHIPTRELRLQVLGNIFKSLKPGGRLVISTWNLWQMSDGKKRFRYWSRLLDWPEKISRGAWAMGDAFVPWKSNEAGAQSRRRYVHSFAKSELSSLLKQSGFEVEWIKYASKDGAPVSIWRGANLMAVVRKK